MPERETLLHILAEGINWFDKYVKTAPARVKQETAVKWIVKCASKAASRYPCRRTLKTLR